MSANEVNTYNEFLLMDDSFTPVQHGETHGKLPAGCYRFTYDYDARRQYFNKMDINSDQIVDLPSSEFDQVVSEMETFLKPETRQLYEENGFIYKRSSLMYGAPGTGKTCIVNRVAKNVIARGGIVLFADEPGLLQMAYQTLDRIQPDVLTLVIFEEFDEAVRLHENSLLSILDGEVQKKNVIYLATTNFIDRVPQRICRPGRFSTMIEVKYPNLEARVVYLKHKMKNVKLISQIAEATEGFSIDELKETVLSVICLGATLSEAVARIQLTKGVIEELPKDARKQNNRGRHEILADFFASSDVSAPRRV